VTDTLLPLLFFPPSCVTQVTAIKTLMEELTVGMKQVNEEILAATCEEGQTHENFSSVMVDFATRAEEELKVRSVEC
jgi:hypothetical protein